MPPRNKTICRGKYVKSRQAKKLADFLGGPATSWMRTERSTRRTSPRATPIPRLRTALPASSFKGGTTTSALPRARRFEYPAHGAGYQPVHIGTFRGFDAEVSLEAFGKHVLTLKGEFGYHVELGSDARGNISRIENAYYMRIAKKHYSGYFHYDGGGNMTVTFCGHSLVSDADELSVWLDKVLDLLIAEGADRFYLGGYGDFDRMAAEAVKAKKEENPEIEMALVTAYLSGWRTPPMWSWPM